MNETAMENSPRIKLAPEIRNNIYEHTLTQRRPVVLVYPGMKRRELLLAGGTQSNMLASPKPAKPYTASVVSSFTLSTPSHSESAVLTTCNTV